MVLAPPNGDSHPICSLGLSDHALSELRDEGIGSHKTQRLAAHVASCPACRQRLDAFDQLAASLRLERPPEPEERLWQSIVTAASASPARQLTWRSLRPVRSRLSWRQLSAFAAVLLLIVGFVALLSAHPRTFEGQQTPTVTPSVTRTQAPTATPSPSATSTSLPVAPLSWAAVGAPVHLQPIVFADNGNYAYMCAVGLDSQGNGALHIWHTSDRGAHWVPARVIPTDPTVNGCELIVDASDPTVAALAWQPRGGGAGDSFTGLMTTVDSGSTWQVAPSDPFTRIDQLDSRNGVIYALRETVGTNNAVEYHVWASSDRMRSWRQVDRGLPANVAGFWLQPNGPGILLVESGAPGAASSQLWSSANNGVSWHEITVPGGVPSYMTARFSDSGAYANGIVARSIHGQFHICVSNATVGAPAVNSSLGLMCSVDGGVTWHAQSTPALTTSQGAVGANLVAIADDGTLLASGLGSLYRLNMETHRWQSLGPIPEPFVIYCPGPEQGILWAIPASGGEPSDPAGRIFAVNYRE